MVGKRKSALSISVNFSPVWHTDDSLIFIGGGGRDFLEIVLKKKQYFFYFILFSFRRSVDFIKPLLKLQAGIYESMPLVVLLRMVYGLD